MNSLSADPAFMASAGIVPGSLSSSGTSSYLTSPSAGMAMMSLASPPMTPKLMIAPMGKSVSKETYGRRNNSPLILPLDISPEERTDAVWWQEMLRARKIYLEDTKDMDWENITVIELKRLLRKYGMNSTGKKTLLIERVQDAIRRLQDMYLGMDFKIDELVAAAEEKSREEESSKRGNQVQPNNAP
jgi:hypothetical protein